MFPLKTLKYCACLGFEVTFKPNTLGLVLSQPDILPVLKLAFVPLIMWFDVSHTSHSVIATTEKRNTSHPARNTTPLATPIKKINISNLAILTSPVNYKAHSSNEL
jgi:hypothetical protein